MARQPDMPHLGWVADRREEVLPLQDPRSIMTVLSFDADVRCSAERTAEGAPVWWNGWAQPSPRTGGTPECADRGYRDQRPGAASAVVVHAGKFLDRVSLERCTLITMHERAPHTVPQADPVPARSASPSLTGRVDEVDVVTRSEGRGVAVIMMRGWLQMCGASAHRALDVRGETLAGPWIADLDCPD